MFLQSNFLQTVTMCSLWCYYHSCVAWSSHAMVMFTLLHLQACFSLKKGLSNSRALCSFKVVFRQTVTMCSLWCCCHSCCSGTTMAAAATGLIVVAWSSHAMVIFTLLHLQACFSLKKGLSNSRALCSFKVGFCQTVTMCSFWCCCHSCCFRHYYSNNI